MLILISSVILALFHPIRVQNRTWIPEYQTKWASEREMIIYEIKAQAHKYGVSEVAALRIASCESKFSPTARNTNSTAYGIYQFLNKTWISVGGGDRNDYKLQVERFMQVYPQHPEWWECK